MVAVADSEVRGGGVDALLLTLDAPTEDGESLVPSEELHAALAARGAMSAIETTVFYGDASWCFMR